jgi:hypothetical protein
MFSNKRATLEPARDVREQRKILPFTVTDSTKGGAARFNSEIDIRNAHKAFKRRDLAMKAFETGSGDVRDAGPFKIGAGPKAKWLPNQPNFAPVIESSVYTLKPSIITRIYNWFLDINY